MQPEDIDQLFRDRLHGHAPTPPDHLWSQLEQELQPAKKRPVMWLYAAAAVIALLLVAGLSWLGQTPGNPAARNPLASTQPVRRAPKKDLPTQATAPTDFASTPSEAPVATPPAASVAQTALPTPAAHRALHSSDQSTARRQAVAAVSRPVPATGAASTTPSARPERLEPVVASVAQTVALPAALTATVVPTRPIEVEVRREIPTVAFADDKAAAPRTRLGAVLHQARNAVNGDPVDLQQVGLPEVLTVQARVGGHQVNKTIQL